MCADQAAAYEVVKRHMSELESCVGGETVSGCMAMYTLGCRNGIALCGNVDVVELGAILMLSWAKSVCDAGGDDYAAGAASFALWMLTGYECGSKMSSASRGPVEKAMNVTSRTMFVAIGNAFTEQRVCELLTDSMKAGILSHEDTSLACGWCVTLAHICRMHSGAVPTANELGVFSATLALYSRVEPSPLAAEWWSSTSSVVDVTSARLQNIWLLFSLVKMLPSLTQASWFCELLDRAIGRAKVNASAGLSGRDTVSIVSLVHALGAVELAAQDESQHEMLIDSGVMDALEYGILNDFTYAGTSTAAYASGAAVALVGRNEGGKVLRQEAVHAVLEKVHLFFQPESWRFSGTISILMGHFRRIPIMAISDANKKHMILYEPLVDMLLQCLILDHANHRKGQDGADALQEASVGVLHELSLFGPGAVALRSHFDAVKTLHKLL